MCTIKSSVQQENVKLKKKIECLTEKLKSLQKGFDQLETELEEYFFLESKAASNLILATQAEQYWTVISVTVDEEKIEEKFNKIIIEGDSISRDINSDRLCPKLKAQVINNSRGGHKISDVKARVNKMDDDNKAIMVIHAGTNDVDKRHYESVISDYREVITKAKLKFGKVVMSTNLPRPDSESSDYRIQRINNSLFYLCKELKVTILNNDSFAINKYSKKMRRDLYKRNDIHLNQKGIVSFAMNIRKCLYNVSSTTEKDFH